MHTRLSTLLAGLTLVAVAAHAGSAQAVRRGLPGGDTTRSLPTRAGMGVIDGLISDSALSPVLGAEVKILSTNVKVNTGPSGRFRLTDVPAGQYVLIVRRGGYAPVSTVVEVAARDTLRVSYTLERATTLLAPAVVSSRSISLRNSEFESRRKASLGQFLSEEEIGRIPAVLSTELMRRFTSINVSPNTTRSSGGMPEQYALSRREGGTLLGATSGGGGGYCAMTVFVDDIRMPTPFNLDLLPSPRNLAGIEVYRGSATIPPKWAGFDSGCGIILVWTKDGS